MNREKSTPNYSYDQTGLEVTIHDIRAKGTIEPRTVTIRDFLRVDFEHEGRQRVLRALDKPRNEGGIGFTLIPPANNSKNGSETLTVYQYPWSGYTDNPVGTNEMAALAAALPTHTILAIDNPATGFSDRLSPSVAREIDRTGSYLPYAQVAVTALEKVLRDFDVYHYSGVSQGARRSIACAAFMGAEMGLATTELHVVDPVGSREQSMLELARNFMVRMAQHSGQYVEASSDILGADAQKKQDSLPRIAAGLWNVIKHQGITDQFIHQPRALAKGGLGVDLHTAFPHIESVLVVTTPALSEFTNPDDIQSVLKELRGRDDGPQRIEHRVLKDQTHALFAGHPGALGVLLSDKLAA